MHVIESPDGTIVSRKFSKAERVFGLVMLTAAVLIIAVLMLNGDYNFWVFSASVFVAIFLFLPGAYMFLFRNEVSVDPALRKIVVSRGWLAKHPAEEISFDDVQAVLCAMKASGKPDKPVFDWLTILRLDSGGLVFTSLTKNKEKNLEVVGKLAKVMDKPVRYVKEKEGGDGYVSAKP
jgi:predicted small integral membrane protein